MVKIRDKHKCKICVALNWDNDSEITAHHIFPIELFPELQFITDNGITLCQIHHKMLHKKIFDNVEEIVLNRFQQTE